MEKIFICFISGGLELLGVEKFKVGGLQILRDLTAIEINPEDNREEIGCELLNAGLAMAIANGGIDAKKKRAITVAINEINLPDKNYPFLCGEIRRKCFLLLLQTLEPEINKQTIKAWDNFFEIAARTAATNIPPEFEGEIDKVKFLLKQFPDIPKAGLSYLRYCYHSGKLPPEENWLPAMLDFADTYKERIDLRTEILSCLL